MKNILLAITILLIISSNVMSACIAPYYCIDTQKKCTWKSTTLSLTVNVVNWANTNNITTWQVTKTYMIGSTQYIDIVYQSGCTNIPICVDDTGICK